MTDAKVSAKSKSKTSAKITFASLNGWNKYLALAHAVQGLLLLILSASRSYPVTTSFLGTDSLQTQAQGHVVLATGSQHLFDINLAFLVALFLFASAIAHGLMATKLRKLYEKDVKQDINKIRWAEYAFSSGIMIVAIGLVVGVQDSSTLLMMFGLVAVMNWLWLMTEVRNQGAKRPHWLSYIIGVKAGILPWIVLGIYLISAGVYGHAPAFVYWIFGTMFVFFCGLAVNTYLRVRKIGRWTDYLYAERVYMILSLVAKTALAWQIFAGSLRP